MLTHAKTIEEIDGHLVFISNILKLGKRSNRRSVIIRADKWLDERLLLTDGIFPDDTTITEKEIHKVYFGSEVEEDGA